MKFLRTINKLIEGLLWLYLPLVLFYWALTPVSFPAIALLRSFLGQIIEPLTLILDEYFVFIIPYEEFDITYTPLVLAGIVLLTIGLTILNNKILDILENIFRNVQMKVSQKTIQKEKEKEWQSFQEELDKNKNIYVMLKIDKTQQHDEYLVRKDEGPFSVGLIDSYTTSISNLAKKFAGKEYTDFKAGDDIYNFVFTDAEKFLQYLKFLGQKVNEINKGTADLNTIFNFKVACSCSYSLTTIDADLSLTSKILNLTHKNEIMITDVLKNKIENLNTGFNLKLEPKGLYMLNDKDVDIFKLKID